MAQKYEIFPPPYMACQRSASAWLVAACLVGWGASEAGVDPGIQYACSYWGVDLGVHHPIWSRHQEWALSGSYCHQPAGLQERPRATKSYRDEYYLCTLRVKPENRYSGGASSAPVSRDPEIIPSHCRIQSPESKLISAPSNTIHKISSRHPSHDARFLMQVVRSEKVYPKTTASGRIAQQTRQCGGCCVTNFKLTSPNSNHFLLLVLPLLGPASYRRHLSVLSSGLS